MRRPQLWSIALLLTILALIGSLGLTAWRAAQVETRYPSETTIVTVAHETTTVPSPTLSRGQRLVLVQGRDGRLRTFAYFEEKWVGGQLRERRSVAAGTRPTSEWITTPTVEVVEVGAAPGAVFQVAANNERGLAVGKIGRSGSFSFRITGSIAFAGAATVSGPHGNARYPNYQKPVVPRVYPGATLIRVGSGGWRALVELAEVSGVYTVRGKTGTVVSMLVNDAPRYYADNRGSFMVSVVPTR